MSETVLEEMIKSYMNTRQPVHTFGWQGGEPTLMGLDFFRKTADFQQKYGRSGDSVANGLQTNATLIDDEMAKHFSKYRFLLGCSLDGPAKMHNRYRRSRGGRPSHEKVLKGIETLKRHNVEFNILILVSQANVSHAREVYHYLVDKGFYYHQYIPCVEFDGNGNLQAYAINGVEWGNFLCELFDAWYEEDTFTVSIRHVDSILLKIVDRETSVCNIGENCCQYFVVEHNGDIYPCDFYVEPQLKLGNVMNTTWEKALSLPIYEEFGAQKTQWNEDCDTCYFLNLCNGDCLKHRKYAGNKSNNLSWLCTGNKQFLRHSRSRFDSLANEIRTKRLEDARVSRRETVRKDTRFTGIGRNDPCPCGSGKKFKKCCGS